MTERSYVLRDQGVKERFKAFIDQLDPTKLWEVTIRPFAAKRSVEQNALFHALVQEIAGSTGNDPDTVKDYLKDRFGPRRLVTVHGEERLVPKSTTQYSVEEMSELIDRSKAWAATELGIFTGA